MKVGLAGVNQDFGLNTLRFRCLLSSPVEIPQKNWILLNSGI